MKLTELNPKWATLNGERRFFTFDCPTDRSQQIAVYIKGNRVNWEVSGDDFENLTVKPSIDFKVPNICSWHGYITNGEVTNC